jgi:putative membrane-bound dehydrogenase-like protein
MKPYLAIRFARFIPLFLMLTCSPWAINYAQENSYQPLVYHDEKMTDGMGSGKHIVFLAGDHEYRSEETCPAMARMMAKRHGFKCTVLFNVDKDGFIEPGNNNMPGLEALKTADLAFVFLRFQNFPDDQMQHFVDYIDRGGPVVGLRTSTHAFKIPAGKKFSRFSDGYEGKEFEKGFGRQILGESWAGHYGRNHAMSTRLDILESAKSHPILRGVEKPWAQCGGYWTDPMPDSVVLCNTQPLQGMTPDSPQAEDKEPCPGVWVRNYKSKSGNEGRVFTTTSGASEDIIDNDFRRLLFNGSLWAMGLENKIIADAKIDFVGGYHPVTYDNLAYRLGVQPQDLAGWEAPIMGPDVPVQAKVQWGKPRPKRNRNEKRNRDGKAAEENKDSEKEISPSVEDQSLTELRLEKGDHLCFVGNELGERMQHHNWFETALLTAVPEYELTVRNLCFPGDEPQERIRSLNFGSPDSHLTHSKASVVLFFFGFNESFAGEEGLAKFESDISKLITDTQKQDYNDDGKASRIVLVSPIAFENTGDKNLPTGETQNKNLAIYTAKLKDLASKHKVTFVDLFEPTKKLFESSEQRLTLNGSHLNDDGYKSLAPIFLQRLIGKDPAGPVNPKIRALVDDKNFHWWHRYRSVNGYSIYGQRGSAGKDGSGTYNNRDVMNREHAILDQMTANRDARIWQLASGKDVTGEIDDSNTLPFLNPVTNVGIPDDPNIKNGKLGTLEYLSAAEQQKLFELPEGFEINLVASEEQFPELANPVNINFDNQGRLWVATMPSYPHWKPKSKLDDKLLILEDSDNDGRSDNCKVFAGGLHQPTGFELGNGGVYVAQQPDILFLQDTDGDDKEDTRIRKLVGFDSADSHHGIAGFIWGPGGNLYFQEGTFKFSQVESPYGLTRLGEAGVWYYNPRTEKFGAHVSLTFSNPWGHIFDRWGQNFIGDASGGLSYWATPISGHIEYPLKHPGGSHDGRIQKFVGKEKGYRFRTLYKKRTRPLGGCEILSSSHFPDEMQGNWLITNCITDRAVLSHKIEEKKSGFWGTEVPPIVSCADGNFRPVDVEIAPDGSLYIVDWHNALIGHLQHNLRDPSRDTSHGRIWRITCKDRPLLTPPKIAGAPIPDLLEILKIHEDRTRNRARRELAERPSEDVIAATKTWVKSLNESDADYEHHMLEALWVHQIHNVVDEALLHRMLESKDHRARAAAVRVLSFWIDQLPAPLDLIRKRITDEHPRVRVEAVRAISFLSGDDAIDAALGVLDAGEMDYYLQYTLDETMRALEQ